MKDPIVVRVGVNNNFNCTDAEFQQLDILSNLHPDHIFFVNSNIKTPNLTAINDHPYKAVLTLNPDLTVMDNLVNRLYDIDSKKIAFVRIKYIPEWPSIIDLIKRVSKTHKVVITNQRFNSKKTIAQFIPDYKKYYEFSCSRYRLKDLSILSDIVDHKKVFICDEKGLGCETCGLCSKLTTGKELPIYTLNLSTSGYCPYNCCDCYAKAMQNKLIKWHLPPIHFDWIHRNHKQSGRTRHIKLNKQALL